MLGTLNAAPRDPLLGNPKGPLKLRIASGDRHGQLFQLHSPKVAIGSSPRCTLRIRTPGVAPVHCLILRGAQHTIIRRLSGDTRLNDAAFDDAILHSGDRLGIGSLEFEVLEDNARDAIMGATGPSTSSSNANIGLLDERADGNASQADLSAADAANDLRRLQANEQLLALCATVKRQSRQRARLLVQQLRALRDRNQELERVHVSRQDEALELDRRWVDLENDIQSFVEQRQRWQEVRAQNERLLVWRREQLEEQWHKLEAQRQAFAGDCAELEEQRKLIAHQFDDLDRQRAAFEDDRHCHGQQAQFERFAFEQRAQELDEQAKSLEAERQRLRDAETDSSDRSSADAAEVIAIRQQFETERQAWDAQRQAWENQRAAATDECDRVHSQIRLLEEQKAAWEAQRLHDTADFETRQLQLKHEIDALEQKRVELFDAQTVHAEKQLELTKLQATFAEEQAEFEQRVQVFHLQEEQLASGQRAMAEQLENVESRRLALEAEEQKHRMTDSEKEVSLSRATDALEQSKANLADQQSKWEIERSLAEATLAERREDLDRRAAEMEIERQQLQQRRDEILETRQSTSAKSDILDAAEASSESSPGVEHPIACPMVEASESASVADATSDDNDEVFARLRALSLLKKDDSAAPHTEEIHPPGSSSQQSAEAVSEVKLSSAEAAPTPAGEESIDDYMSRLLERMRGISGDSSPKSSGAVKSDRPTPSRAEPAADAASSKSAGGPSALAKKLLKLEPRKIAPEKSQGLAAMREIANLSARSAIATHHHRRRANRAWSNMAVGMVGLGCGVWLLIQSPETDSPFFYGGLMGLVVSVYWFAKARLLARSMRSSKRHNQQQFAAMSREQSAPNPKTDDNAVGKGDSDTSNK
jgi:uncharacterized protein YeeX (DUF496 family)